MSISPTTACPLCGSAVRRLFCLDFNRLWRYWRCPQCHLSWRDPAQWLSAEAERHEYELHDNRPDDPGYQQFLGRLATPLLERLSAGSRGLDFGCGPGPALARLLEEAGHSVALYDPFFYPERSLLAERYDFVCCTEAAEHFHEPGAEFRTMIACLKPGGLLAIMTGQLDDDARFARWRYRHDPTHVCFFKPETFNWLSEHFGLQAVFRSKDVWIGQIL